MTQSGIEGEDKSDGDKRPETTTGNKTNTTNNQPRCPACYSTQIHVRQRDMTIVCHRCGIATPLSTLSSSEKEEAR